LLGAVGGLIMVILGAVVYKDKILIIMGSCGMLITIAIYSFLIYMASDINNFSEPMQQMTEMQLKTLVKDIEFYKTTKGTYPATLKILTDGGYSDVYGDPSKAFYHKQAEKIEPYYYQLQGDKYYLFSTGKDGKPFTKDDILPPFHGKSDYEKIGLIAR
jgi:hypothetical protein